MHHNDNIEHNNMTSTAERMSSMFGGRAVDPQMADVLDMLESLGGKPIAELSADDARKQPTPADAVKKLLEETGRNSDPEGVLDVDNRRIAGPAGDIEIRIYTPASAREGTHLPIVFYVHGGGWVIANLDVYDSSPRALCNAVHAKVVSTHYRQGPEDKFPAAHEDVYAAYKWTVENAQELGCDPSKIAIVGESAGGNMAAAVCMRARDEGFRLPDHEVLVYPVADASMSGESYAEMKNAKPLNSAMMGWFFDKYLKSPSDGASPMITLTNGNLAGLPPATIISAELDPLRSEGEALARALSEAGVPTTQRTYPGVTHEFFGMGVVVDKAQDAIHLAAKGIMDSFGTVAAH
ncbi:alpha/beta hydrolase [soil metagenome]